MKAPRMWINVALTAGFLAAVVNYWPRAITAGRGMHPQAFADLRFEVYLTIAEAMLFPFSIGAILLCGSSPYWFAIPWRRRMFLIGFLVLPVPFFVIHCAHWARVSAEAYLVFSYFAPISYGTDLPGLWSAQLVVALPIIILGIGYCEMARRLWFRLKRKG